MEISVGIKAGPQASFPAEPGRKTAKQKDLEAKTLPLVPSTGKDVTTGCQALDICMVLPRFNLAP